MSVYDCNTPGSQRVVSRYDCAIARKARSCLCTTVTQRAVSEWCLATTVSEKLAAFTALIHSSYLVLEMCCKLIKRLFGFTLSQEYLLKITMTGLRSDRVSVVRKTPMAFESVFNSLSLSLSLSTHMYTAYHHFKVGL